MKFNNNPTVRAIMYFKRILLFFIFVLLTSDLDEIISYLSLTKNRVLITAPILMLEKDRISDGTFNWND